MRIWKSLFMAFATAMVAFVPAGAQIAGTYNHLIVPGVSAGPFFLGMTEPMLLALGKPSSRQAVALLHSDNSPAAPGTMYCYYDEHICATVDQTTSEVAFIDIGYNGDCASYKTADGVTCGVDLQTLNASMAMGTPDFRLTRNNPFNHTNYAYGFHSPSGGLTEVFFVKNASSMADATEDTVQYFTIHAPGIMGH